MLDFTSSQLCNMDDFVFDLDKALDELEEEEDVAQKNGCAVAALSDQLNQYASNNSAVIPSAADSITSEQSGHIIKGDTHDSLTFCNGAQHMDDITQEIKKFVPNELDPVDQLDLSEADFAPAISTKHTQSKKSEPPDSLITESSQINNNSHSPEAVDQNNTVHHITGNESGQKTTADSGESESNCNLVQNGRTHTSGILNISSNSTHDAPADKENSSFAFAHTVESGLLPQTENVIANDELKDCQYTAELDSENVTLMESENEGSSSMSAQVQATEEPESCHTSGQNAESSETSTDSQSSVETVASCTKEETSIPVLNKPISAQEGAGDIDSQETASRQNTAPSGSDIESADALSEAVKTLTLEDSNSGAASNEDPSSVSMSDIVGFNSDNTIDLDLTNNEMEQYLSTVGGPDNYTEFDAKPSLAAEIEQCAPPPVHRVPFYSEDKSRELALSSEPCGEPELPEDLEERRDSGGSVEKFLVPSILSPSIATPIEDPGFSKVPGYMPDISDTIVEEEEEEEMVENQPASEAPQVAMSEPQTLSTSPKVTEVKVPSPDLRGARPKEQSRISRPNSLLGLSTPDLPSTNLSASTTSVLSSGRDSGIIDDIRGSVDPDTESSSNPPSDADPVSGSRAMHDIINMQLASQKNTPLTKKQLNLAIQQHSDTKETVSSLELSDHDSGGGSSDSGGTVSPSVRTDNVPDGFPNKSGSDQNLDVVGSANMDSNKLIAGSETSEADRPVEGTAKLAPGQNRPTSLSLSPRTFRTEGTPTPASSETYDDASAAIEAADVAMAATGSTRPGRPKPPPQGQEASQPQPSASGDGSEPAAAAAAQPPPASANINLAITELGRVAPKWVPDAEAAACMQCETRFTFTKRRHHCRACGKVFCNSCCNLRSRIPHMDNKEARVCSKCYQDLIRAQVYERTHQPSPRPTHNNPSNRRSEGPKQVMFSDGIRPGGDLTELDGSDQRMPAQRPGRRTRRLDKTDDNSSKSRVSRDQRPLVCLIPEQGLPPVLLSTGVKGDFSVEENPDAEKILPKIKSVDDPEPVVFAINKNLFVLVKILNLDCCVNRVCWCFTTKGMCTVGQDEIVIVLECLPDEKTIPRDIFCHFHAVYEEANKGNTVSHLGHTIFAQGFLGCRDHSGFLYVSATYQCLQKLILPSSPYIFGILLQKWETPWAKVFPIRLMLRLGAEYRYYPCPLISVRFRKPVFSEIGHTIMNLLADFRNFQYMLPQVAGVTIHMEDKRTSINFPRNRYNNIMKVLANSNDHVMALGANFSVKADSHLVCLQNEEGAYQTQAINIQNKPRKITGASFVVFNGAFKQSGGLRAKSSIVEDGLMVQITAEAMVELKESMRNMSDYSITCGSLENSQPEETVVAQWVEDDTNVNIGVKSCIDEMSLEGVSSIRIHTSTDFVGEKHTVRWTEVFFIRNQSDGNSRSEPVDLSRLAESLAHAMCVALTPLLDKLHEAHLTKIGLRATIDPEQVAYEVGASGTRLPAQYMDPLDSALIPVIHSAASQNQDGPIVLELVFHIIE